MSLFAQAPYVDQPMFIKFKFIYIYVFDVYD